MDKVYKTKVGRVSVPIDHNVIREIRAEYQKDLIKVLDDNLGKPKRENFILRNYSDDQLRDFRDYIKSFTP